MRPAYLRCVIFQRTSANSLRGGISPTRRKLSRTGRPVVQWACRCDHLPGNAASALRLRSGECLLSGRNSSPLVWQTGQPVPYSLHDHRKYSACASRASRCSATAQTREVHCPEIAVSLTTHQFFHFCFLISSDSQTPRFPDSFNLLLPSAFSLKPLFSRSVLCLYLNSLSDFPFIICNFSFFISLSSPVIPSVSLCLTSRGQCVQ